MQGTQDEMITEIQNALSKDISTVHKYISKCHQGILADVMTPCF